MIIVFFFFKQKTAYEMRISDWSSDVCSSDLHLGEGLATVVVVVVHGKGGCEALDAHRDLLVAQRRLMIQGDKHARQQPVLQPGDTAADADDCLRCRAYRRGPPDRQSTSLNSSH